jgi:hypothetical protein
VRPGILQAHPGKYKGAPWLGRAPHRQGTGAPPRRTWSSAGCALRANPGIAQAHPNEGACAKARLGLTRAHTASPRFVPGLCSCALKARPSLSALLAHSSAELKCACKAVDIYMFASLSGLQSRHGLHRQLLQHAATEAHLYGRQVHFAAIQVHLGFPGAPCDGNRSTPAS